MVYAARSRCADDSLGEMVRVQCGVEGLATEGIVIHRSEEGSSTARYIAVLDAQGELHTAIADMDVLERLTPNDVRRIATFRPAPLPSSSSLSSLT